MKEKYQNENKDQNERKEIINNMITLQKVNIFLSQLISSIDQSFFSDDEKNWREKGIKIRLHNDSDQINNNNNNNNNNNGEDDDNDLVEKELSSSLLSLEKLISSSTFKMIQSLSLSNNDNNNNNINNINNNNNINGEVGKKNFIWREIYKKIFNTELINITNKIGVEKQSKESSSPSSYSPPHFSSKLFSFLSSSPLSPTENIHIIGNNNDVIIIDDVISKDDSEKLFITLSHLVDSNFMKENFQKDVATRFDSICWLSESSSLDFPPPPPSSSSSSSSDKVDYDHLMEVIKMIKGAAGVCEEVFKYKLAVPKQCMAACYDGNGAHYVAHHDNVCQVDLIGDNEEEICNNHRMITLLLYVNPFWTEKSGGNLRCYLGADQKLVSLKSDWIRSDNAIEIEPIAGRLVIFKSKELLHEVCPSFDRRMAISCWLLKDTKSL